MPTIGLADASSLEESASRTESRSHENAEVEVGSLARGTASVETLRLQQVAPDKGKGMDPLSL